MCDLWYMQSLTKFIKIISAPLYLKMTPEGILIILDYRQFLKENMDENVYNCLTTKGIVNIMPEKYLKLLKPSINQNINEN